MGVANHQVPVVRITEIEKHPNADTLGIVRVLGYQVIVKLGEFKAGDLCAYIPPDSVLPDKQIYAWFWDNNPFDGKAIPEKYRRVTSRRFRKEWSEGLLVHLTEENRLTEGDDAASILGITHYEPPEPDADDGDNERSPSVKQSKRFPRSLKGWLYLLVRVCTFGKFDLNGPTGGANVQAPANTPPIYDVEAFKNHPNTFVQNESVVVTEKIHGTNARFVFVPSAISLAAGSGKMYAGSRKLWKSASANCIYRKALKQLPWIEKWCRQNPNHVLYGELVPAQKGFDYGCEGEQIKFFPFDIRLPDGSWRGFCADEWADKHLGEEIPCWVPVLYVGPYSQEWISKLIEGKSTVRNAQHVREGIVIRPITERLSGQRGLGRVQLKIVSNTFLEKDKSNG